MTVIEDGWRRQIGPCALEAWGEKWITVRCPSALAPLVRQSGGVWDPGRRLWLVERRRAGPLMRRLEQATDPLFRQAELNLDGEGP
jgi:hypothetical protein